MSSFTCNTCGLAFASADGQRNHMKSDWHRYNLKRRVAQLPSISLDVFNEKVSKLSINGVEDEEEKTVKKNQTVTKKELRRQKKEELIRQKRELLEKARADILNGQRAIDNKQQSEEQKLVEKKDKRDEPKEETEIKEEPNLEKEEPNVEKEGINVEKGETDEQISEEAQADKFLEEKLKSLVKIDKMTCLFCKNRSFSDVETNVMHMFKNHGLYIPEQQFLVNLDGLLEYLGEKVGFGNVCLVCNYQGKNVEAVRSHMISKCHCRLPYETEDEKLEISEFYDFSSTYKKKSQIASDADEGEWEDVSEGEEEDDEEEANSDDDYDPEDNYLYNDGVELYLPSGIKVGHRSLARYFKQDLKPEKTVSEGQGTVITAETRHLVTVLDRKELDVQKRAWKTEVKDKKRDDKRSAKHINFQKHYRDPLLQ